MKLLSLIFSDCCSVAMLLIWSFPYFHLELHCLLLLFIKYCYDSKIQNYIKVDSEKFLFPFFPLLTHSESPFLSLCSHYSQVTYQFLDFIACMALCTNEQIHWYFLIYFPFFIKGYLIYYFSLCFLHLKINPENYSVSVKISLIFSTVYGLLNFLKCLYT